MATNKKNIYKKKFTLKFDICALHTFYYNYFYTR